MTQLLLAVLLTLPAGERLTYQVKYGPLSAGSLALEVVGIETVGEESCYHLVSRLWSNPSYSSLFWLNDRIESFARTGDLVTLRTVKDVHESNYQKRVSADFDYEAGVVNYSDSTSVAVQGESRDLLSLWYYCRELALEPGDEFTVSCHADKRTYDVTVHATSREGVRTRLGLFSCLRIEMLSSGPAGSGTIWLSDDEQRLPVVIKTRLPLGYLTATLTRVRDE